MCILNFCCVFWKGMDNMVMMCILERKEYDNMIMFLFLNLCYYLLEGFNV
jgi:hypothetical protein